MTFLFVWFEKYLHKQALGLENRLKYDVKFRPRLDIGLEKVWSESLE